MPTTASLLKPQRKQKALWIPRHTRQTTPRTSHSPCRSLIFWKTQTNRTQNQQWAPANIFFATIIISRRPFFFCLSRFVCFPQFFVIRLCVAPQNVRLIGLPVLEPQPDEGCQSSNAEILICVFSSPTSSEFFTSNLAQY